MNNTKTLTAIAAIFIATTLVVGIGTFTTTRITQSAYAYQKKGGGGDNGKGNDNGNTVTIEECKNKGSASGFDTATNQECENLICTHPGNNATCTEEGVTSASPISIPTPTPTPTPEPTTTTLRVIKKVVCPSTDPNCSLPITPPVE